MSEAIPQSVPTSHDKRSNRPTKRQATNVLSAQAQNLEALFANPDRNLIPEPKSKTLAAPPEIVANVQGSSAGAGSGEFHVYKASRRREYERLRAMDEATEEEETRREFEARKSELKALDEAKTAKNRARRQKAQARKGKGAKDSKEVDETKKGNLMANIAATAAKSDIDDAADGPDEVVSEEPTSGIVIHDDD